MKEVFVKSKGNRIRTEMVNEVKYIYLPENIYQQYQEMQAHSPRYPKRKEQVKNVPSAQKKQYQPSPKSNHKLKKLIATVLIAGTVGTSIYGLHHYMQDQKEYTQIENSVAGLTEDEIREQIDNVLKEEISEGTGESTQHIHVSNESYDRMHDITTITVGEKEYVMSYETDSLFPREGNARVDGIRKIIMEANTASRNGDRRGLIKALKNAKEFSAKKGIKVEKNQLTEENER